MHPNVPKIEIQPTTTLKDKATTAANTITPFFLVIISVLSVAVNIMQKRGDYNAEDINTVNSVLMCIFSFISVAIYKVNGNTLKKIQELNKSLLEENISLSYQVTSRTVNITNNEPINVNSEAVNEQTVEDEFVPSIADYFPSNKTSVYATPINI